MTKDFKEPDGRNSSLPVEVAGKLLDACHPHPRPIALCAIEKGMRKAEILGLRRREIRNGRIYLPGGEDEERETREIPVSDTLANELQRMKTA